jgi:pilus assembly protein CpaC
VINPADSAKASDIAARFMVRPSEGSAVAPAKVINLLQVEAKEQVMLKVTVAEVSRELIKRLGVNLAANASGAAGVTFNTANGFPATGGQGTDSFFSGILGPNVVNCLLPKASALPKPNLNCLGYTAEAFERTGLVKTLAEPTLTAISGETAAFLAGGEFPVPIGSSSQNGVISTTIQFKPFGVGLSFTPIVQSEGRITLKVATEVSDLSNKGAVTLIAGGSPIPALTVRRANTTVELPSGGSMVLGGLISDSTKQNIDGIPGLRSLPILGALFRSRDFQKEETELMVIATPYTVNPVGRNKLVLPTDGLDVATDTQAALMGQINKVYGKHERAPEGEYRGNYGFIVE